MPLSELLGALRRRKWFIILLIAFLTAAPTIYGLCLQPKYTAMASIVIEPQQNRIINLQEVMPKSLPDVGVIGVQADVIRSRELMAQTMADLDLFQDPEFLETSSVIGRSSALISQVFPHVADWLDNGLRAWAGPLAAAIGDDAQISWASSQTEPREAMIDIFASRLEISQPGDSYVLRVSFSSVDPVKAARIVNHLIASYLANQLHNKISATQNANLWLNERLQTMQNEVLDSERKAAEFRSNNRLATGSNISVTDSQLVELTRKLTDIQTTKAEQEAKLEAAKERGSDAIAEVLASPVVADLRMQDAALLRRDAELATDFGERHPLRLAARDESAKLKERINQEVARTVEGVRSRIAVLASQERMLQNQVSDMTGQSGRDTQAAVRLGELEREATAKRTLYAALLSRYQETSSQNGILQPDARLVAQADVPSVPSTPSPLIFGLVGFTAATVFSCMLALLRDQLDTKLYSGRQIERDLRVKCVGLMPNAPGLPRGEAVCRQLHRKPRSAFTQAVRAIYTEVMATGLSPQVVLVTSALPDEGKTSLATSLAVCAAQGGIRRTLIVDFDLWRPGVARDLNLTPQLGIAELLDSDDYCVMLEAAILRNTSLNIDILPAARFGNDRIDLEPRRIGALLAELRRRYDCIFIDSPPLLGMSDGRILSQSADVTLFAIRWRHTRRDAAAAGLRVLQDVPANLGGAVLTRVDPRKHAQDGQGDGLEYYTKFSQYYVE